jgi:hypothetical protein
MADKPTPKGGPQAQRAAVQRERKLEEVAEQVRNGSLSVRQMTDEERAKYPPRPRPAKAAPKKKR